MNKSKELIKVKYVLMCWWDTVNTWAYIRKNLDGTYRLEFDDGVSFDSCALFNPTDRKFYCS